jgi:hypothetical protein
MLFSLLEILIGAGPSNLEEIGEAPEAVMLDCPKPDEGRSNWAEERLIMTLFYVLMR